MAHISEGNLSFHRLIFLAYLVLEFGPGAHAQEPAKLSGPGISPTVWGVLEIPSAPGPHPGVIILHGSAGWRPAYAQYAKALRDSGFVAEIDS